MGSNFSRAALACAGLLSACAQEAEVGGVQHAIVDGHAADSLWGTVGVGDRNYGYVFCTGTLIAPDVVLTAAHCVVSVEDNGELSEPSAPGDLMVRAGTVSSFDANAQDFDIEHVVVHEEYRVQRQYGRLHDVALLLLAAPIPAEVQEPVEIMSQEMFEATVHADLEVLLAGFGTTDPTGATYGGVLYEATAPFIGYLGSEFIVGEPGTPDTCYGDSGGPVYYFQEGHAYVIGVTSRGATAGDCGSGGVYGSAAHHREWIIANAEGRVSDTAETRADDSTDSGADELSEMAQPAEAFSAAYCTASGSFGGSSQLPWILALLVLVVRNRRIARRS